jgi:hypothetical protein
MKKMVKLFNDIPPVTNGVISASKTPVVDEGRLVDIQTFKVTDMSIFFDSDVKRNSDIPDYTVADSVKSVLQDSGKSEEALRDAVYTDLIEVSNSPSQA